jgi:hypothetical protein
MKKRSGNNIPERFENCFMSKRRLLDESLSIELSILQDLNYFCYLQENVTKKAFWRIILNALCW